MIYIVTDGKVITEEKTQTGLPESWNEEFEFTSVVLIGGDHGTSRSQEAKKHLESLKVGVFEVKSEALKSSQIVRQSKKNRNYALRENVCPVDIVIMYESLNCQCNTDPCIVKRMEMVQKQIQKTVATLASDVDNRQYDDKKCCRYFDVKIAIGHFNQDNTEISDFMDTTNINTIRTELQKHVKKPEGVVKFSDRVVAFKLAETKFNVQDDTRKISENAFNPKLKCRSTDPTTGACARRIMMMVTDDKTWSLENEAKKQKYKNVVKMKDDLSKKLDDFRNKQIAVIPIRLRRGDLQQKDYGSAFYNLKYRLDSGLTYGDCGKAYTAAPSILGDHVKSIIGFDETCWKPPTYGPSNCEVTGPEIKLPAVEYSAPRGPCGKAGRPGSSGTTGEKGATGKNEQCCHGMEDYFPKLKSNNNKVKACEKDDDCKPHYLHKDASVLSPGVCVNKDGSRRGKGEKFCSYCHAVSQDVNRFVDPIKPRTCNGKLICCQGRSGVSGASGPKGPPGDQGGQGKTGEDGPDGNPGKQGIDGEKGPDGIADYGKYVAYRFSQFQVHVMMQLCACKSKACQDMMNKIISMPFDDEKSARIPTPIDATTTKEAITEPEKVTRAIPATTTTLPPPPKKVCSKFSHMKDSICKENVCKCRDGTPTPKCVEHDSECCSHCNLGFRVEEKKCVRNICTCDNGDAALGITCTAHGSQNCVSCAAGYDLDGKICKKQEIKCTCDNGTPASGEACIKSTRKCSSCDAGFYLNVGNVCTPCICDNGVRSPNKQRDGGKYCCGRCGLSYKKDTKSKNCDLPKSLEEYCGKPTTAPGLILHINMDKSEGSKYAKIANCASGLLKNLPLKTVTTMMFMPSPYDFATTESMNAQNTTGSNKKAISYINEVVGKIRTGETSQGNYDIDNAWYVYMLNMKVDQYFETGNVLYNPNLKHTVQLTFTDQQDDLEAKGISTDSYGSNFNSNIVVASSENMNSLTDSTENFIEHDWSKDCDQKFYNILKKTICASVADFEKEDEESRSDGGNKKRREASLRNKRMAMHQKRKYDIEINEKMQREKRSGRFSLEFADDWETADEDVF